MNYYYASILRAVDFIENSLTRDINLSDIIKCTGFSKFHFLRLFKAVSGYTVNDYIRRRRLTEAARLLVESDMKIIDIAVLYEYNSQEAFTRAFKEVYNITPHFYRIERLSYGNLNQLELTEQILDLKNYSEYIEPRIVEKDEFHVAGISYEGRNQNNEVPKLWNRLYNNINSIKYQINNEVCYGIEKYSEATKEDGCFKYFAGIEVSKFEAIDFNIETMTVKKSKYAVFPIRAIVENVPRSISKIYGTYLPLTGLKIKGDYDFEYYDMSFIPNSSNSFFHLYIPIE